jgi:AcrR family transcriptional regulator
VLEVAAAEFAEHGLAGARIERIAAQAGLNVRMIYYHFSSKEELYRAVADPALGADGRPDRPRAPGGHHAR